MSCLYWLLFASHQLQKTSVYEVYASRNDDAANLLQLAIAISPGSPWSSEQNMPPRTLAAENNFTIALMSRTRSRWRRRTEARITATTALFSGYRTLSAATAHVSHLKWRITSQTRLMTIPSIRRCRWPFQTKWADFASVDRQYWLWSYRSVDAIPPCEF
jgi:hypothetical protein